MVLGNLQGGLGWKASLHLCALPRLAQSWHSELGGKACPVTEPARQTMNLGLPLGKFLVVQLSEPYCEHSQPEKGTCSHMAKA